MDYGLFVGLSLIYFLWPRINWALLHSFGPLAFVILFLIFDWGLTFGLELLDIMLGLFHLGLGLSFFYNLGLLIFRCCCGPTVYNIFICILDC